MQKQNKTQNIPAKIDRSIDRKKIDSVRIESNDDTQVRESIVSSEDEIYIL